MDERKEIAAISFLSRFVYFETRIHISPERIQRHTPPGRMQARTVPTCMDPPKKLPPIHQIHPLMYLLPHRGKYARFP